MVHKVMLSYSEASAFKQVIDALSGRMKRPRFDFVPDIDLQ